MTDFIFLGSKITFACASLVAQMVKNLPAMWETWVPSLGQEDPLEKEMATHSSICAWRIPWTEEPGGPQSMGSQRVRYDWVTNTHTHRIESDDLLLFLSHLETTTIILHHCRAEMSHPGQVTSAPVHMYTVQEQENQELNSSSFIPFFVAKWDS